MKSMQILNLFGKTPLLNQSPARDKDIPFLFGQMLKQFVASNLAVRNEVAQSGKGLKRDSVFHPGKNAGNKILQQKNLNPPKETIPDIQPKMLQKMKRFAGKLAQFIESNPNLFEEAGAFKTPSANVLNTLFSIEEQDFTKLSVEDTIAKINQIFQALDTGLCLEMKHNAAQGREIVLTSEPKTNQNAFKPYLPFLLSQIAQLVENPLKIVMPAIKKDTTLMKEVTETPTKKEAVQTNKAPIKTAPETPKVIRSFIRTSPAQKEPSKQTEEVRHPASALRGESAKIQTEKQTDLPGMKKVTDQKQFGSQKSANHAQEPTAGQNVKSPAGAQAKTEPVKSGIVFGELRQKNPKANFMSAQNRAVENTGQTPQKSTLPFDHKNSVNHGAEKTQPQSTPQKSEPEQYPGRAAGNNVGPQKTQNTALNDTKMFRSNAAEQVNKSTAGAHHENKPDSVSLKNALPVSPARTEKTDKNKTNDARPTVKENNGAPIKEKELPGKFFIKSRAGAAADHKPELNRQNINPGQEKASQQKIKADIMNMKKTPARDKSAIQSPAAPKTENKTVKNEESDRLNKHESKSQRAADIPLNRPSNDAASMKSESSRRPAASDGQTKHQANSGEPTQAANSAGKNAEVKNIAPDKQRQQQTTGQDALERKESTPSEKVSGKNSQVIDFTQHRPSYPAAKSNPLNVSKLVEPIVNHKIFQNPKAITEGRFRVESSPVGRMEMHYTGDQHQKSLTITVESEQAKAELAKLAPQIQDSLQQKGVEINQIKIDVGQFAGKDEQEQTRHARRQENQSNQTQFREEANEKNKSPVEKRNYGYNTIEMIA